MIKVLEDAVEKGKKLPKEQQAEAAEILEQLAADAAAGQFTIPEEHMEAVLEGLEQARSAARDREGCGEVDDVEERVQRHPASDS